MERSVDMDLNKIASEIMGDLDMTVEKDITFKISSDDDWDNIAFEFMQRVNELKGNISIACEDEEEIHELVFVITKHKEKSS